jgi:hypothetical protein
MPHGVRIAATLTSVSLMCLSCAGARLEGAATEQPLAKPTALLVYDFAVTPEDVVADTLGPSFEAQPTDATQPSDEDHAIARALSDAIVAKLREKGIDAARSEATSAVPKNALLLQGQFVTIKKGSRVARMAIGFGAGRQELRVQAQMYQWTGANLRHVKFSEAVAHGDRMPGMAAPVAVGTVVTGGLLAPVLVSGSLNVGQEVVGGLRPTLDRLAGAIADDTAKLYRDRGWL